MGHKDVIEIGEPIAIVVTAYDSSMYSRCVLLIDDATSQD